jgi:hypothetical protein
MGVTVQDIRTALSTMFIYLMILIEFGVRYHSNSAQQADFVKLIGKDMFPLTRNLTLAMMKVLPAEDV